MTRRGIGLLGVPSSAGAHWPGQEKAPRALREAGLVGRLGSSGLLAQDHGDLPPARFRPDPGRHPQSLDTVVSVARAVAGRVEEILKICQVPFVVGGDCTVELGVIPGSLRAGEDPPLLYLDGGVDLYTPATNPTGILDSMGVAHMVGEPGVAEELSRIGPRNPLMPDDRIVLFGYEPNPPEMPVLERRSMPSYPAARVRGAPRRQPRRPSPSWRGRRTGSWSTSTWTSWTSWTSPWPTCPSTTRASPSKRPWSVSAPSPRAPRSAGS